MKRIAAWILVALLLCSGVAQAAEWADGLSPSKPYENEPEINLEETLGYMMFFPKAGNAAQAACDRLYIYLPREDVKAGEGTFYLLNEQDGVIWSTAMNDADAITQRSIDEAELDGLLWGSGTCFEIMLPRTLELGKPYFVNMTRGCIVAENGVENAQIGGTDLWTFTVEGEYGISGMEYRRAKTDGGYEEQLLHPQAGDEIRFDLVLGGDAAVASIYALNGSVDFLMTTFTASGEVIGDVISENVAWGVVFLDAGNNVLDRIEFWK